MQGISMRSSLHLVQAFIFLAFTVGIVLPASAEGPIRTKIKERLRERAIEKLEDKPAPEINASITDPITLPGDYTFSIQHDELTRMYRVHVPASYNKDRPTPVLFAFHGGGGDMGYMARDEFYGLITKSEQAGFIVVFPNGYSHFQSGNLATWNAGKCCAGARDKNIDDVGFVREIVKNITSQMNVDRRRIFATGMSNGGMISYRLACEMADTFRAIAAVAGTDSTIQCNPSRPISIMHIHAKNDTHVLFNGGAGKDAFKDLSQVTNFTSVPETIARWTNRNQCRLKPQRVLNVDGAYCDSYTGCRNNVEVKLCVTETGAHSWPGGKKPRGETPSTAISANDEMWKFFQNQR